MASRKLASSFTTLFLILGIIIGASFFFVGGFGSFPQKRSPESPTLPSVEGQPSPIANTCCDSGDGDACALSQTHRFSWKGTNAHSEEYALITSGVSMQKFGHVERAREKTPEGNPIYLNTTDSKDMYSKIPGCEKGKDLIGEGGGQGCMGIPNDEIIFVCRDKCEPYNRYRPTDNGVAIFDIYFRVSDGPIPDVIKSCIKTTGGPGRLGKQKILLPTASVRQELQLTSFKIVQEYASSSAIWFQPYCKPAIYLYPEKTSDVSVKINPVGPITYTDPEYKTGWKVTARPDGHISYGTKAYDYLYYETQIPDEKLIKPTEGFVVKTSELASFFDSLLPKLGLKGKEKSQFSDYWLKVLPSSSYYFIGIMPKPYLDKISPLTISPTPKNVIRVTLYFEPLEKSMKITPPSISEVKRDGFTVVEWGGIYKSDKNHNFSCFQ